MCAWILSLCPPSHTHPKLNSLSSKGVNTHFFLLLWYDLTERHKHLTVLARDFGLLLFQLMPYRPHFLQSHSPSQRGSRFPKILSVATPLPWLKISSDPRVESHTNRKGSTLPEPTLAASSPNLATNATGPLSARQPPQRELVPSPLPPLCFLPGPSSYLTTHSPRPLLHEAPRTAPPLSTGTGTAWLISTEPCPLPPHHHSPRIRLPLQELQLPENRAAFWFRPTIFITSQEQKYVQDKQRQTEGTS